MRAREIQMTRRSRRERAATVERLYTPPGKRRVLSVVQTGHVVPIQTERVHMALRGMCQGEPIRRRMARVVEMKRIGRGWIDPHCARRRHVDEVRCSYGPRGAAARETDRRRLNAQKFSL